MMQKYRLDDKYTINDVFQKPQLYMFLRVVCTRAIISHYATQPRECIHRHTNEKNLPI